MKTSILIENTIRSLFEAFPALTNCEASYVECSNTNLVYIPVKHIYDSMEFNNFDAKFTRLFMDIEESLCFVTDKTFYTFLDFINYQSHLHIIQDNFNNLTCDFKDNLLILDSFLSTEILDVIYTTDDCQKELSYNLAA